MRFISMVLIAGSVSLAGCSQLGLGGAETACGGEDAKLVVAKLVREQVVEQTRRALADSSGGSGATSADLRSLASQAKVELEDVRTTRDDPDSTKRFCSATLVVTLPERTLGKAEEARSLADADAVKALSDRYDVQKRGNAFRDEIDYTVQPTDDGKQVFAELEEGLPLLNVLGEVVASSYLADEVRNVRAEEREREAVARREADALAASERDAMAEQGSAAYGEAKAEYDLAVQRINAVWQSLPSSTQAELRPIQRAWIKRKTADCKVEAAGTSADPKMTAANQLLCETRLMREREGWLNANSGYDASAGYE